jgi:GAF domain-containing protein/ActR/RegA family two-component response regulator
MRWTIRAKLITLVVGVLALLAAGAVWSFWLDLRAARAQSQEALLAVARASAHQLDVVLSGRIESLQTLASVRALDRLEPSDLVELTQQAQATQPFLAGFLVVDAEGRVVVSSGAADARPAPSIATAAAFQAAMKALEPQVDGPREGALGAPRTATIVVPATGLRGQATGAVVAEIDLDKLSGFLDVTATHEGITLSVISADRELLASTSPSGPMVGRMLGSARDSADLIRPRDGVGEWTSETGVRYLAAATGLTRAPWLMVAATPSATAYGPAGARFRANLLGLGIVTALALAVAWLIARQFAATVRERERALAGLAARERRFSALTEVNAALSQDLDLAPLLRHITEVLARLTGAPAVLLWDVDDRRLIRRAWTVDPSLGTADMPIELGYDQGGTGWVARNRAPLFVDDVSTDERLVAFGWARDRGLLAFAGVPVVSGDTLLGVLTLNLRRGEGLGEDSRALLISFASQAALAVRNARLFSEAQARRREAESLAGLGRVLAQTLDPVAMAQEIADCVRALIGTHTSGLYRLEPGSGDMVAVAISGDAGPTQGRGIVFPRGTGVASLAAQERRPIITPNLLKDPRFTLTPEVRARIEQATYRSVLSVPLVARDAVIGSLSVGDVEGRVFTDDDVRVAQAVADQAALSLDNARLYVEGARRRREAEELARVARRLTETLDVAAVGRHIVEGVGPLIGAAFTRLRLREPDGTLRAVAWAGTGPDFVGGRHTLPRGAGIAGRAVEEGKPVWVADFAADSRTVLTEGLRQYSAQSDSRSVLGVPLRLRGEIIGALTVGDRTGRVFTPADIALVEAFADQAALALDNARLYEETRERLRALQETQTQLVQAAKLSAVGQLVSGVAHELNNPLSVVIGHGQLMLTKNPPPEFRRPIELIVAQGDRMSKIVQGLLLFSRQRSTARGPVSLPEIVEQTLFLRAAQLRLSGIEAQVEHAPDLSAADGDAHQLQQVILNLILNAEQAILAGRAEGSSPADAPDGAGARIRIRMGLATVDGVEWVSLEVEDNGPGIAPDVLPRVFDPFFTTKAVGQGTGLGLSVSYGIVEQHAGHLLAESRPGRTVFTMLLPRYVEGRSAVAPAGADEARAVGAGRAALVVDDEPAIVDLVVGVLERTGWKVDVADGGRGAIERVRGTRYDLIVSDIRMPDGDGEEFYRAAVAAQPALAGRFLFMTGDTANPRAWEFLHAARVEALEKPFKPTELLAAVERLTT